MLTPKQKYGSGQSILSERGFLRDAENFIKVDLKPLQKRVENLKVAKNYDYRTIGKVLSDIESTILAVDAKNSGLMSESVEQFNHIKRSLVKLKINILILKAINLQSKAKIEALLQEISENIAFLDNQVPAEFIDAINQICANNSIKSVFESKINEASREIPIEVDKVKKIKNPIYRIRSLYKVLAKYGHFNLDKDTKEFLSNEVKIQFENCITYISKSFPIKLRFEKTQSITTFEKIQETENLYIKYAKGLVYLYDELPAFIRDFFVKREIETEGWILGCKPIEFISSAGYNPPDWIGGYFWQITDIYKLNQKANYITLFTEYLNINDEEMHKAVSVKIVDFLDGKVKECALAYFNLLEISKLPKANSPNIYNENNSYYRTLKQLMNKKQVLDPSSIEYKLIEKIEKIDLFGRLNKLHSTWEL